MTRYAFRHLAQGVPLLLGITLVIFLLVRSMPGGPLSAYEGNPDVTQEDLLRLRTQLGLDEPLPVQYVAWLGRVARGDLGTSLRTNQPVSQLIMEKLPVTVELALLSLLVAVVIAIPAGVIAAVRKGGAADVGATVFALSGLSVPNFWLGIMLILLFSVQLKWLPASGYVPFLEDPIDNLRRMVMPAFVLGTGLAAVIMRQTRSSMLEVLKQDFVRTARAKGARGWAVIVRHAMRNALLPVVTVLGLQLGALLSGAVLTEQVFTIPGFGKLVVDAVFNRDYAVVQGVVLFTATAYIGINLVVDVGYALLNPKIAFLGRG